ncbi:MULTISPECIES: D-alanine--D-alanine ligase family protein [Aminobacterium]|uniref:D-alanine--D-alanine ligase n=1 Tax=Aminobacterium colombiense (strain DSM 12261 / ALA-1) TaxID=572547 RepID=D5ECQ2_AMICL|nr:MULTISPECIES: hypothetical protein [Aminobacterium]ADE56334.1 D-alanine--D-alanine ligase [Aminobacterium colombiense DSM 12261]MDD4266174.1 D-alanine--D-alanine ligase [Aminobacterium colombiense]
MTSKEQPTEPPGSGQRPVLIAAAKEYTHRQDLLDCLICREDVGCVLSSQGYSIYNLDIFPADLADPKHLVQRINEYQPLCVFNLFEGFGSEPWLEASFCEILEKNNLTFTGNPSGALRLCIDKHTLHQQLKTAGIPVPLSYFLKGKETLGTLENISFPLFIKPCREDGSVGIDKKSLVFNEEELQESVTEKLAKFPDGILIQEFLSGPEYCVSFVDNGPFSPVGLWTLDYSRYPECPAYLSYDAKWNENSPEWNLWPEEIDLDYSLKETILHMASRAALVAGCKGYFRVDLRENQGHLFVMDINPNPALTRDSGMARQYMQKGKTYEQLVMKILQLAILNYKKRDDHENN